MMVTKGFEQASVKRFLVIHSTGDTGEYHVSVAKDQEALAVPADGNGKGDFTRTLARSLFNARKRGVLFKFALHVFQTKERYAFIGYGLDIEESTS